MPAKQLVQLDRVRTSCATAWSCNSPLICSRSDAASAFSQLRPYDQCKYFADTPVPIGAKFSSPVLYGKHVVRPQLATGCQFNTQLCVRHASAALCINVTHDSRAAVVRSLYTWIYRHCLRQGRVRGAFLLLRLAKPTTASVKMRCERRRQSVHDRRVARTASVTLR